MKVGIIIATNDHDTCFLAIRYAAFNLMEKKDVRIYFVDSGLEYNKSHDRKYNLSKLLDDFVKSGGKCYKAKSRETLKNHLASHFDRLINVKQIESICYDDKFQSIMTKDTYIRKFIKTSARENRK